MMKKTASILILSLGVAAAGNAAADERDVWPIVAGVAVGAVLATALSDPPRHRRAAPVLYATPRRTPIYYAAPAPVYATPVRYVPVPRPVAYYPAPRPGYRHYEGPPPGHWRGYR